MSRPSLILCPESRAAIEHLIARPWRAFWTLRGDFEFVNPDLPGIRTGSSLAIETDSFVKVAVNIVDIEFKWEEFCISCSVCDRDEILVPKPKWVAPYQKIEKFPDDLDLSRFLDASISVTVVHAEIDNCLENPTGKMPIDWGLIFDNGKERFACLIDIDSPGSIVITTKLGQLNELLEHDRLELRAF